MAIASTGPIGMSTIQGEYGGAAPTALSEYYKGGANVPSGTAGSIATSGRITMSSFRGTVKDAGTYSIFEYANNSQYNPQTQTYEYYVGLDVTTPSGIVIGGSITVTYTFSTEYGRAQVGSIPPRQLGISLNVAAVETAASGDVVYVTATFRNGSTVIGSATYQATIGNL